MKTIKMIPVLFALFLFLVPVQAQENTISEVETVLREVPTFFKNIRGEIIPNNSGIEMYQSTVQHEKADFVGIGVTKGTGAIYQIAYSYENDPELAIFSKYAALMSSLKNEGYKDESFEEEVEGLTV